MIKAQISGITVLMMGLLFPTACEQSLRTGRVGNTSPNAPNQDGTCPVERSLCGQAGFAQCLDLQTDPEHCGACNHACVPGIACAGGACQQVACSGPVTVSSQTVEGSGATISMSYWGAILADINGDGRLDLVTWGNEHSLRVKGTFQVALGQADGVFGAASIYQASTSVQQIVAGNHNDDGYQDLFITASFELPCTEIWLGHADGKLTSTASTGVLGCLNTIAIGDLNGDGRTDLVTPDDNGRGLLVYLADAHAVFSDSAVYAAKSQVFRIELQDWNGDGSPDLLALSQTLSVYLNKGNGTFETEMDCGIYIPDSEVVVIADFNQDGYLDLAVGMDASVGVLLGMGGCQFQTMTEYRLDGGIGALSRGDLNGDGIEDLVAQTDLGGLSLLLGVADGTFQFASLSLSEPSATSFTSALLVGEVTGDGKADIVVVPDQGPAQIVENTCL